jgi:hypothetical protein
MVSVARSRPVSRAAERLCGRPRAVVVMRPCDGDPRQLPEPYRNSASALSRGAPTAAPGGVE